VFHIALAAIGLAAVSAAAQPRGPAIDMVGLLARVGDQVERYFMRAQSVICRETLRVQTLRADLLGDGTMARHIVSDLRVVWDPSPNGDEKPEATVLRDVVTVNGRRPRPKDDFGCWDPKPISPEPLSMLLPDRQQSFAFTWAGFGRVDRRPVVMVDYKSLEQGAPIVTRRDNCISIELPGKSRGRLWIDQETGEVLRLDEGLTGMVDVPLPPDPHRRRWAAEESTFIVERADTSIRYKRVTFQDPEEAILLPASIDTLTVIRNSGAPRVRMNQVFSDYRRFVTEGRIIQ
jgi:hypothetical protein